MCQTVGTVVPAAADEPPPPLEDLQIELPVAQDGAEPSPTQRPQQRVWAHAPRMDAAAAASGEALPLVALQLGGGLWKVRVRALPVLSGRAALSVAALRDSSSLGNASGFIGNGADSSTPPGSPLSGPGTSAGLPRSELERVEVPAVTAAGLRCVRMFWNVLVGDVMVGLLGDGSGFSSDGGAIATPGTALLDFGDDPELDVDGTASDFGAAAVTPPLQRTAQQISDEVDSTAVEAERVMRAAYRIPCPDIPMVDEGVPHDVAGTAAFKHQHEGIKTLLDTGVAYCERVHVLLLERFGVVTSRLDDEVADADTAGVQAKLAAIVDRNALLRERVAVALQVCDLVVPFRACLLTDAAAACFVVRV